MSASARGISVQGHDLANAGASRVPDLSRRALERENARLRALLGHLLDVDAADCQKGPRIIDLCWTAFDIRATRANKDDGGACDWFSDTRPVLLKALASIRAEVDLDLPAADQSAPGANGSPSDYETREDVLCDFLEEIRVMKAQGQEWVALFNEWADALMRLGGERREEELQMSGRLLPPPVDHA